MPAVIEIVTNREASNGRMITVGSQRVRIKKPAITVSDSNAELLQLLDTIGQPGADLNELFQQKREEMIREVLAQADRVLEDQTLRGRTILASGEKWKSLWKECEKIRKEDAR